MKLRFTPRATQDLAAIADYIHERNPAAARLRVHEPPS
jgi:plasmid stabilization system protein ParE